MKKEDGPKEKQVAGKKLIGETLVESGLITAEQLDLVLKRQSQVGGHLGSLMIEMGLIQVEDLLEVLSRKHGVPWANLYDLNINANVIKLIPFEKIRSLNILPISVNENVLILAMVNPHDFLTVSEIGFRLGKKIKPVVVPYFMMEAAVRSIAADPGSGIRGKVLAELALAEKGKMEGVPKLSQLLRHFVDSKANDMLLTAGVPPSIKIRNEIRRMAMGVLAPEDCLRYAKNLMNDSQWKAFEKSNECEFAVVFPEIGRFRVSVYRQRNSISIAMRNLPDNIPSLGDLNLPLWLEEFALKPQGLIIISSPAGHGKSTTLNAMVDIINSNRRYNVVTFEDPIEYLHKHKMCNVNQREIGRDTESFNEGLKYVLKQAPDVIVVGDMRDRGSFEIALEASKTGHLVLASVHADNSTGIIEKMINMFEPYQQGLIRSMLADSLLLSFSQRLVPSRKESERIPAYEKFINSYRMRNMIREAKIHHVRSQMQTGADDFTSMDICLADLCKKGLITVEDAMRFVYEEQFFRELLPASLRR